MNYKNYQALCKWIDNGFCDIPERQKHKKGVIKIVGITIVILLTTIVSGQLLEYYARIQSDIDVLNVILVDGMNQPSITDSFSVMAGSTINISHNVSNLHSSTSIPIFFNITNVDTGLLVSVNPDSVILNPLEIYTFNITYTVSPYANPEMNLTSTVEVQYENY